MSTQSVTATVGNNRMSKVFGGTITDGVWTNIQDNLSSTNLGILMPRTVVSNVQGQYEEGLAAWRIQNAQSLFVNRRGWASTDSVNCYSSTRIPPYSIAPDDMIQFFPLAKGSGKTNALAWVTTTKGTELYKTLEAVDNTATEMKTALQDQSLGDAAFNSTITAFSICLQEEARLEKVEFVDSAGGVILTIYGGHRLEDKQGLGMSPYYNLDVTGLGLPITKGFTMKITTFHNQ